MAEIKDLDVTDANNTARFPENMQFRNVNDSARALEGMLARDHQDSIGTLSSSGSSNAYTVTTNRTISAYYTGMRLSFAANHANTGAATLNVNSLGAKSIVAADGSSLGSGDIIANQHVDVVYSTTRGNFQLVGGRGVSSSADVLARVVKVGSVLPWPTATVPGGWLECDGSAVSRTTYAALFAEISTTYGAGDGSTTFNLPDYRGYFLRGQDGGVGVDPDASSRTDRGDGTTGDSVGTKQADASVAHTHSVTVSGKTSSNGAHTHSLNGLTVEAGGGAVPAGNGTGGYSTGTAGAHTHTVTSTGTAASTGGSETRPDNVYVKFIILANPAAAAADTIGVNGLLYKWSAGTSGDPGAGYLGFDNATLSSATAVRISETDAAGAAVGPMLALWDDSTSTIKGTLYIYKVGDLSTWCCFQLTGSLTDSGDYDSMSATYVGNGGSFSANDQLAVLFVSSGVKGDTGATGPSGNDGGVRWDFDDSTTTAADPGTGLVRLNNATFASVTEISISYSSGETGNPDVEAYVKTWDDSTNTSLYGTLIIGKASAPENFVILSITSAITDGTTYGRFTVAYVSGSGSFTDADALSVQFSRTGNLGATGSAGSNGTDGVTAGLTYTFDAATSGDPGTGDFLFNNATVSSATAINISDTDGDSNDVSAFIATWDDVVAAAGRGFVTIRDKSDSSAYAVFKISGNSTDNTTYWTLSVTHVASGGTFSGQCSIQFVPSGADGAGAGDMAAATYDPGTIAEQLVGLTASQTLTNKTIDDAAGSDIHANVLHKLVRNSSGAILAKGDAVYISGFNVGQNIIEVDLADADNASAMPAIGIIEEDIANNTSGELVSFGVVGDLDTSAWSTGDALYVSTSGTSGNTLTNTKPTGTSTSIQKVAHVLRSHATAGSIFVIGAGRSNDVPNGYLPSIDEDDMVSNSAAHVPTQQSVKAYVDSNAGPVSLTAQNVGLAVSASAGALTIALKGADGNDPSGTNIVKLPFRSATGTTGTITTRSVTAATSLDVSSGSTLGVTSSEAFRLWVTAHDDGGTIRLGVMHAVTKSSGIVTSIKALHADGITDTTAEGGAGAADSAGVIYTGSAVTAKPYIILGYLEWNTSGVTAGTWTTTNLSVVQVWHSGIPTPGQPTGNCAQVFKSDVFTSTTATTWTDITNFTTSITPSSAANLMNVVGGWNNIATAANVAATRLVRGSTALLIGDSSGSRTPASTTIFRTTDNLSVNFNGVNTIDAPQSASAVTYKVQFWLQGGTYLFGRSILDSDANYSPRMGGYMTVQEIMA